MRTFLAALGALPFCALAAGAAPPRSSVKDPPPALGAPVASTGTFASPLGLPMCGGPERQELDKITALNMIDQQKTQERLRPVIVERDEASARYAAFVEKQKLELAPGEAELKRQQLAVSLQEEKFKAEVASLRQERERLHLGNEIAHEKFAAEELKADAEKLKIDMAMRDLDFQSRKLRMDAEVAEHRGVALKADLDLREKKAEWKREANREPVYLAEPFKDGVLTLSDRRITLDGPIVMGTGDFVTERIQYFNNKDESLPIFIVIDRNPGGSVMEGYRIVKAIQASRAPVHVVVKSYAASMAAVIATLSPRSYAYPNAILVHHQMAGGMFGNITQQKEQLEVAQEWYRRLAEPVAAKMGVSLGALVKEMYRHNSDGDWEEFADKAVKLKWVDRIVHEVRETGIVKEPEIKKDEKPKLAFGLVEEIDARGERFVRLPRLQPFDAYWLYDPNGYYR